MNSPRRTNLETGLYILAFGLALSLRFIQLGALPLSDVEATWAMQSLELTRGLQPVLGTQPGYVLLTSALFFLFESTNFLARFWPAILGSLLTLAPLAFRDRIGRSAALVLAFGLALDPGLVGLSRQAGSLIPALSAATLAWAAWEWRKPALTGILAGIALLSGPSLWMGVLVFGLTYAITEGFLQTLKKEIDPTFPPRSARGELKVVGAYGIATLLLGGTLFFLSPNGLSAAIAALPEFIRGWTQPSGIPATRLMLALFVYEPMPLVFALIALVRGLITRHYQITTISLWALLALLIALVYPARQVADLAWISLPLWILAAQEIGRHLDTPLAPGEKQDALGAMALMLAILGFAWMDLNSLNYQAYASPQWNIRFYLLLGALALLGASMALIALGWSVNTAMRGWVLGTLTILGIYTIGSAWGTTGLRTPKGMELWFPDVQPVQTELIVQSVDEISGWSTGISSDLQVQIVSIDSPALEWALRNHSIDKQTALDLLSTPYLLITPQMNELALPAAYRGQDFVLRRAPLWTNLSPYDWVRWLTWREYPQQSEVIVLWARNDLFIDAPKSP